MRARIAAREAAGKEELSRRESQSAHSGVLCRITYLPVTRALCRTKLLPVTHGLADTRMLTVKPVYKLSDVPGDLK